MAELTLTNRHELSGFYSHGNYDINKIFDSNNVMWFESASDAELQRLLHDFKKYPNLITNICFNGNDLEFCYGNLKVILKERKDFVRDSNFDFIFNKIKRMKLIKKLDKVIIAVTSISLVSIMSVSIVSANTTKNINDISADNSTSASDTYVDSEATDYETAIVEKVPLEDEKTNGESEVENIIDADENDEPISKEKIFDDEVTTVLNIGSEVTTKKAENTKTLYYDIIKKYSEMYGIDSNLMCAIATQERGKHATIVDAGGAIGLMQIQVSVWNNKDLTVYNWVTNENETIHITLEKLRDVDFNIKVGCAIYQNYLNQMNGNFIAATQCYNMGPGTMKKILSAYSNKSGKTIDEILNDKSDLVWMDYINSNYPGDPDYVEHVFRYYNNDMFNVKEPENNGKSR